MRGTRTGSALAAAALTFALAATSGCDTASSNSQQPNPTSNATTPDTAATTAAPGETATGPAAVPSNTAPANPDPSSTDPAARGKALADCMRANGVPKFPYPHPDGTFTMDQFAGLDMSALQQAWLTYCPNFRLGKH